MTPTEPEQPAAEGDEGLDTEGMGDPEHESEDDDG